MLIHSKELFLKREKKSRGIVLQVNILRGIIHGLGPISFSKYLYLLG